MESIIQMVLDSDWTEMTQYTEKKAAEKIAKRISDKKEEVVAALNAGFSDSNEE